MTALGRIRRNKSGKRESKRIKQWDIDRRRNAADNNHNNHNSPSCADRSVDGVDGALPDAGILFTV